MVLGRIAANTPRGMDSSKAKPRAHSLSTESVYRIAVEVDCNARTVTRWLSGARVLPMTANALVSAAERLGIKAVPKPPPEQPHAPHPDSAA